MTPAIGRAALAVVAGLLALIAVAPSVVTARLVGVATADVDDAALTAAQGKFLTHALDRGAARASQAWFPEGFVFQHALTALARTRAADPGTPGAPAALQAGRRALEALDLPSTARHFDVERPAGGAFLAGWSLLVAVEVARLSEDRTDRTDVDRRAAAAVASLAASPTPFLESYPGSRWPVDTVVLVAALARADALVGVDGADGVLREWPARALSHADPATGLLPHRVDGGGGVVDGTRGSSQALVQVFWPDVDPAGAARAWQVFVDAFVVRRLGLVGVLEYPSGVGGPADVDSGPLVLGVSASASAVTLAAARRHGDVELADALSREAELAWLPGPDRPGRSYLLGLVPVADAFLAWARAQPLGPVVAASAPRVRWWLPAGAAAGTATALLGGALLAVAARRRLGASVAQRG